MSDLPQIYLASSSPRRQELLQQMGVRYKVVAQQAEEHYQTGETAEQFVIRLALEKARDAFEHLENTDIPVLGSDTAVVYNNNILGKPKNKQHAIDMLMELSNQTHQVITAVALLNQHQSRYAVAISEVSFSKLNRQLCDNYWATGEPVDKAGAYGIQGRGALFIRYIKGSYSGIMGLPVYETAQLLKQFQIYTL